MANCIRAVPKFALDMAIKGEIYQALANTPAFDTEKYGDQLLVSLISGKVLDSLKLESCSTKF